jgi:formate dehydrogenase iron-sulfur subunit
MMNESPLDATVSQTPVKKSCNTPYSYRPPRRYGKTAVEQFSELDKADQLREKMRLYSTLLPTSKPAAGQQYAFKVDLEKCSACKACVAACHGLNGLDEDETWRSIGTLVGVEDEQAVQQTVTTACHHCVDPACLNGCPVLAYEKDPVTGIVKHLDDQCIGCQYCVWKCPYDVPEYVPSKGIVRKCDMCTSRLAVGEAPACVQACPSQAIAITLVDQKERSDAFRLQSSNFMPGTHSPAYTVPTTQYLGIKSHNLKASDEEQQRVQHCPGSLLSMLIFTQWSAGIFAFMVGSNNGATGSKWSLLANILLWVGILSSLAHLGRPHLAWKAFLGWRRSWLSREIIAFSAFMGAALAQLIFGQNYPALIYVTAAVGLIAVASSMMIYHDTQRPFWNWKLTGLQFLATVAIFGATTFYFLDTRSSGLFLITVSAIAAKIGLYVYLCVQDRSSILRKSGQMLTGKLKAYFLLRVIAAFAGLVLMALPEFKGSPLEVLPWLAWLVIAAGEVFERNLFFSAVHAPKMPGIAV